MRGRRRSRRPSPRRFGAGRLGGGRRAVHPGPRGRAAPRARLEDRRGRRGRIPTSARARATSAPARSVSSAPRASGSSRSGARAWSGTRRRGRRTAGVRAQRRPRRAGTSVGAPTQTSFGTAMPGRSAFSAVPRRQAVGDHELAASAREPLGDACHPGEDLLAADAERQTPTLAGRGGHGRRGDHGHRPVVARLARTEAAGELLGERVAQRRSLSPRAPAPRRSRPATAS